MKIPDTPPSLEQAEGMPLPEEIYSNSCSSQSGNPWRSASMVAPLQSRRTFPSLGSCTQHLNPCAETLVHTHSSGCADHRFVLGADKLFLLVRTNLTTCPSSLSYGKPRSRS